MSAEDDYKALADGELHNNASRSQWVTEAFAGFLASILVVVLNVSAASVVFHKGYEYEHFLPHGINTFVVCTAISNTLMLLTSYLPLISGANAFVASLYAEMAKRILKSQPQSPFGTLAAAMGICTFVMGVCHWILGAAHIGKVVQFVPTPVMAGFQASIGYVLINSSIEMLSGCQITQVDCLYEAPSQAQLVLTVALGIWLTVAQFYLRGLWRTLLIPSTLVTVVLVFQLVSANSDGEVLDGWNLSLPAETALSSFAQLQLTDASWPVALWEAGQTAIVALVPNVINILLTLSALEQRHDSEVDVDYDYELRSLGPVYLGTTAAMMAPNPQASVMLFVADLGGRSRLAAVMVIISSIGVATLGCDIVNAVPTVAFAGLLFSNGMILLSGQIIFARKVLPKQEQILVILHISLTTLFGMFAAVLLGLACTALLFVMEYTLHSGVMQCATSQLERSRVERPLHEQEFLQKEGASILIVHLHGMIFFGSANAVLETVRAHVKTLERPLCCLVLDFERCSEVDSSAVTILLQTQRTIQGARLVCAAASLPVLQKLESTVAKLLGDRTFKYFPTLDLALEFCEMQLLLTNEDTENHGIAPTAPTVKADNDVQIYTPRSAKSHLQPHILEDARKRFASHMAACGASDLEPLFDYFDIVCMRPKSMIRSYCPDIGLDSANTTRDLFILDIGHVTAWLYVKTWQAETRHRLSTQMVSADSPHSPPRSPSKLTMTPPRSPSSPSKMAVVSPANSPRSPHSPSKLAMEPDFPQTPRSRSPAKKAGPGTLGSLTGRRKTASYHGRLESFVNGKFLESKQPEFQPVQTLQHRWHRLSKIGPGTFIGAGPFAAPPDPCCVPGRPVFPRIYQCDTHCQFFGLPRSRADWLEQQEPLLMQKLYRVLASICDSFAANHATALMASEAFNVTIRPSRAFGRWLVIPDLDDEPEISTMASLRRSRASIV